MNNLVGQASACRPASAGLCLILLTTTAFAASPIITELQPRGAERNHAFTLTISGRDLPADARISSTLPASFTPTINNTKSLTFLVEPKPEAVPGVYPIRLESSTRITSTSSLFRSRASVLETWNISRSFEKYPRYAAPSE